MSLKVLSAGDVCVNLETYDRRLRKFQTRAIRRIIGTKAIVHFTHCPEGMVFAVDTALLFKVHLLQAGDVCVNWQTYDPSKPKVQMVQIRRFSSNGLNAIVHYVHCPEGIVFAVDVELLFKCQD